MVNDDVGACRIRHLARAEACRDAARQSACPDVARGVSPGAHARRARALPTGCLATLIAGAVVTASPGLAQQSPPPSEPPVTLDPITVTSPRVAQPLNEVPAAIDVVEGATVQRGRQLLGLDESLTRVPGLFLQNRYNFAQDLRISIRGFGAQAAFGIRGVKILVDGIPATLPDGQGSVDAIDLGSVERIEVLRGPASVLYGNASGGVISITSESGKAPTRIEARLATGADGFDNQRLKLDGEAAGVGFLVSASNLDVTGFREHSAVKTQLINAKLTGRLPSGADVNVVASYVDSPEAQDPGGVTRAVAEADPTQARQANLDFDAGEALEIGRVGVTVEQPLGDAHRLRLRAYGFGQDFANRLPFESGGAVAFERTFVGGGAEYRYDGLAFGEPVQAIVGVDVEAQRDDRRRFDNQQGVRGDRVFEQEEDVTAVGLFALGTWEPTPRLGLSAGVRGDQVEFDVTDQFLTDGDDSGTIEFNELSASVGLRYSPSPPLTLFSSLSNAFETPTTTELADPDGAGFNEELAAQRALNVELGVRGDTGVWSFDAVVFRTWVDDGLVPFELEDNPGRTFFRNAGESLRDGVELAGGWRPAEDVRVTASYTYSDFEFERFEVDDQGLAGNDLPGIPTHQAFVELAYEPARGVFAVFDTQYVGRLFADDANQTEVDAYAVSNMRVGYSWRSGGWALEGFAGVNNLFDVDYFSNVRINAFGDRFFEPAPARATYLGVRIAAALERGH